MAIEVNLSPNAMRQYVYGDNSAFMMQYLSEQMANMSSNYGNLQSSLMQSLQSSYDYMSNEMNRMSLTNELINQGLYTSDDYILALLSYEELKRASINNQRWIMAHMGLRQVYLDQNCDGYSETYVNMDGTAIGQDQYDYRRATNGWAFDHPEIEDLSIITNYHEILREGDRELSHIEKANIMDTWETITLEMNRHKYDFTKNSDEDDEMNL